MAWVLFGEPTTVLVSVDTSCSGHKPPRIDWHSIQTWMSKEMMSRYWFIKQIWLLLWIQYLFCVRWRRVFLYIPQEKLYDRWRTPFWCSYEWIKLPHPFTSSLLDTLCRNQPSGGRNQPSGGSHQGGTAGAENMLQWRLLRHAPLPRRLVLPTEQAWWH